MINKQSSISIKCCSSRNAFTVALAVVQSWMSWWITCIMLLSWSSQLFWMDFVCIYSMNFLNSDLFIFATVQPTNTNAGLKHHSLSWLPATMTRIQGVADPQQTRLQTHNSRASMSSNTVNQTSIASDAVVLSSGSTTNPSQQLTTHLRPRVISDECASWSQSSIWSSSIKSDTLSLYSWSLISRLSSLTILSIDNASA